MGSNGLLLRMIKVFVRVSEDVPQGQFFAKVRAAISCLQSVHRALQLEVLGLSRIV
eukprot:COSAG02_NODE_1422_length_12685_cov_69.610361_11_plen_56_part_00